MKLILFVLLLLLPSVSMAQEFDIIVHEKYEYVLEENEIQFGSVGLLTRSLLDEANAPEYNSYDRAEFSDYVNFHENDDLLSDRQERFSSWERREIREEIANNLIEQIPNMCLVVPNFDDELIGGCLYHFNPRPRYVRFEE